MKHLHEIIRAEGGTNERRVPVSEIQIPDLWHLYVHIEKLAKAREAQLESDDPLKWPDHKFTQRDAEMVLDTWHLCHDLLKHLRKLGQMSVVDLLAALGEETDSE